MYAVVRVGGKQERVEPGDVLEVELMKADPGETIELEPIVIFDDDGKAHVGKDLGKASVKARLLGEKKGDKLRVFKYRPKSGYRRSQGHRQRLTMLEVQEVALSPQRKATAGDAKREEPAKKEEPARAARKTAAKKSPARKASARKTAAKKTTVRKTAAKRSSSRKKAT
jgi:large subunit ribosomal protein L21